MTQLQWLALVIPYSGNTKVRCDPGLSLDTFYMNNCNFCYPFLSIVRGRGNPKIVSIGHFVLGNLNVRYYTCFSSFFT